MFHIHAFRKSKILKTSKVLELLLRVLKHVSFREVVVRKNNLQRRKGGIIMTLNELRYWENQETIRSHKAQEAETYRSNVAKETETNRHNVVTEVETNRHNVATEGIDLHKAESQRMQAQASKQQADAAEFSAHVNAQIADRNATVNERNAATNEKNAETARYKAEAEVPLNQALTILNNAKAEAQAYDNYVVSETLSMRVTEYLNQALIVAQERHLGELEQEIANAKEELNRSGRNINYYWNVLDRIITTLTGRKTPNISLGATY